MEKNMTYKNIFFYIIIFLLSVAPVIAAREDASNKAQIVKIYETLNFVGLKDVTVSFLSEGLLIKYNQPLVKSDLDTLAAWFYIMGSAAKIAPETEKIIILMCAEDEPLFRAEVNTKDVQEMLDNNIDMNEFRSRVKIRAVSAYDEAIKEDTIERNQPLSFKQILVDGERNCYRIPGWDALEQNAVTELLYPGKYRIKLAKGDFSFWTSRQIFEPFVCLFFIFEDESQEKAFKIYDTHVDTLATFATLRGIGDELIIDVYSPIKMQAFFIDISPDADPNRGSATIAIEKLLE
jgi:hypothetical protein